MFTDRTQAGQLLGRMVAVRLRETGILVLALPRGGVPVGIEVARCLKPPVDFDIFLVRKLGVPDREELAFGAIASGGVRVLNRTIIEMADLSNDQIEEVARREQRELERRERLYRNGRSPVPPRDRTVLLIDDGLATGATMIAAVRAVREQHARRLVVAAPVASREAAEDVRAVADEVICGEIRDPFYAVGYWYRDFDQVSDDEVRAILKR